MRFLAALCAGLLAISVSPRAVAQTTPVTIEYWHVNTEVFGGPAVRELVAKFESLNPGIKVVERFQPNTYTGLLQNLQTRIAANNPPDVAQIGYLYVDYAAKNFPYVSVQDLMDAEHNRGMIRNAAPSAVALGMRNGKLVGMPYAISNIVTFYNADMLKAAGVDPNKPPQTWAEWTAAAKKIKAATGKPGIYVQVLDDNWSTQAMIESNGGRMLACTPSGAKPTFDSPEAAGAIQMWSDLVKDGLALNVLWNQGEQAFLAGQVATFVTTIAKRETLQKNAKFDLRATGFPRFGNKPPRLPAGGNVLMVFSQAPEKRAATLKFIEYLESPTGFAIWTRGTGYIPVNVHTPEVLGDFLQTNPIERVAIDQTKYVVPWTSFPGSKGLQAQQALFGALQRSLGGAPAAQSLHDAAASVAPMIAGERCTV
ncbi:MAG: ABC transporter substrate-binding protein [Candidatus Eremiobacteraeota bacterium]|nr:ABC transporter substrate-binding protein [Candidatus Eremiobacteraeota bacterium]